jgi:hypothetical protein
MEVGGAVGLDHGAGGDVFPGVEDLAGTGERGPQPMPSSVSRDVYAVVGPAEEFLPAVGLLDGGGGTIQDLAEASEGGGPPADQAEGIGLLVGGVPVFVEFVPGQDHDRFAGHLGGGAGPGDGDRHSVEGVFVNLPVVPVAGQVAAEDFGILDERAEVLGRAPLGEGAVRTDDHARPGILVDGPADEALQDDGLAGLGGPDQDDALVVLDRVQGFALDLLGGVAVPGFGAVTPLRAGCPPRPAARPMGRV